MKEQVEDIADKDKAIEINTAFFKEAIYAMKDKEVLKTINKIFQNVEPTTTLWETIKKKFQRQKNCPDTNYKEYFDFLIDLEPAAKEYGIARMKKIEAENDTKTIPYLLTVIIFMLPYYKTTLDIVGLNMFNRVVSEELEAMTTQIETIPVENLQQFLIEVQNRLNGYVEGINTVAMLLLSVFILILITSTIAKSKAQVQSAIYFRSLLESAKVIKKERETAAKKQSKEQIEQIEQIEKQQERIENKQEKIEYKLFLLKKKIYNR